MRGRTQKELKQIVLGLTKIGLSTYEIARALNVSQPTIWRLLKEAMKEQGATYEK